MANRIERDLPARRQRIVPGIRPGSRPLTHVWITPFAPAWRRRYAATDVSVPQRH